MDQFPDLEKFPGNFSSFFIRVRMNSSFSFLPLADKRLSLSFSNL